MRVRPSLELRVRGGPAQEAMELELVAAEEKGLEKKINGAVMKACLRAKGLMKLL